MQPNRQIELRHRGEDRLELGIVERFAGDVGVDQHATGAEILDGTTRLSHGAFDIGQAKRCGEARETLGMFAAQFAHCVIRNAGELYTLGWTGNVLDCRIWQRDNLPVLAELVHFLEARVEIEQFSDAAQPLADILELGRDPGHFLEKALREDVAVDIDDRAHGFPPVSSLRTSRRCSGKACQPKRSAIHPHRPFGAHNMTTMATAPIINK